eukprot:1852010-Amphidinium_carterae.1
MKWGKVTSHKENHIRTVAIFGGDSGQYPFRARRASMNHTQRHPVSASLCSVCFAVVITTPSPTGLVHVVRLIQLRVPIEYKETFGSQHYSVDIHFTDSTRRPTSHSMLE